MSHSTEVLWLFTAVHISEQVTSYSLKRRHVQVSLTRLTILEVREYGLSFICIHAFTVVWKGQIFDLPRFFEQVFFRQKEVKSNIRLKISLFSCQIDSEYAHRRLLGYWAVANIEFFLSKHSTILLHLRLHGQTLGLGKKHVKSIQVIFSKYKIVHRATFFLALSE